MNKTDLINALVAKTGFSVKDATLAWNSVFEVISDGLVSGAKIPVTGFGTFEVKDSPARKGRNPLTGEELEIPARKAAKFKPGKSLKDSLNA